MSNTTASFTFRDFTWHFGQRMTDSWHVLLGPCPSCSGPTFDYGGGWACCDPRCRKSPENLVCNNGPRPESWPSRIQR